MKQTTHWQKCFDIESEITYLGEKNPGEHYFGIKRSDWGEFLNAEDDECYLLLEDGIVVGFEGYSTYPSVEEEDCMKGILKQLNII